MASKSKERVCLSIKRNTYNELAKRGDLSGSFDSTIQSLLKQASSSKKKQDQKH
jgi:hypothetical protein